MESRKLESGVFQQFKDLIYAESGIVLTEEKRALLLNRIGKRLRALGISTPEEYLHFIAQDSTRNELVNLLNAISTNVTYFYREKAHFEFLEEIFRRWKEERRPKVRVWCAAASTGQEPYTINITAAENLDLSFTDYKLLATDICTEVLETAHRGIYSQQVMEPVPKNIRDRYFERIAVGGEECYRVVESLRKLAIFRVLNLAKFPYPLKGGHDIIFCRNVMIYFDRNLRKKIVDE
ncbi:MAG: protein-glutamate O-methyltransferase CheR, partial [Candidatus Dadabacteria bacterium]